MSTSCGLISDIRAAIQSAAFLISKEGAEKAAHSELVQSLVLLSQLEKELAADSPSAIVSKTTTSGSSVTSPQEEKSKVEKRVPKWFRNPQQINSKILMRYLELSKSDPFLTQSKLRAKCEDIKDFDGNYNQMKNFGPKNHGKVFEEKDGCIELWEPVRKFILEQYEHGVGNDSVK